MTAQLLQPDLAVNTRALVDTITRVLVRDLALVDEHQVHPDAHLLVDLGLDSVSLMQLLVALETRHGVTIPTAALSVRDFSTINALAQALAQLDAAEQNAAADSEIDIKVHCFVSCLCEPIRQREDIDHRPFYFGVWDAPVFVDDQSRISYHAQNVSHAFFADWFRRLYGVSVQQWYRHTHSRAANLAMLQAKLAQRKADQYILVMLDLYQLPERENKFNKNPFPHYVMLENVEDPERIWMWDPDFRWQGALDRSRVLSAIDQPSVAGGYDFDVEEVKAPDAATIAAYFDACFNLDVHCLTQAIERIVLAHSREGQYPAEQLAPALRELPVLAIRKYAFEHGLAFFWRAMQWPWREFEHWCEQIEILVRGFDKLVYLANRYALQGDALSYGLLWDQLRQQDELERQIKLRVQLAYRAWLAQGKPMYSAEVNGGAGIKEVWL